MEILRDLGSDFYIKLIQMTVEQIGYLCSCVDMRAISSIHLMRSYKIEIRQICFLKK